MSKRFTDTDKYKKPFLRGLQGAYKLLWDYIYNDCNHAGIWIVDFEIAQIYLGADMKVNREDALRFFNADKVRVIELDGGNIWFILTFIEEQYGVLNPANRVHNSIIDTLKLYDLLENYLLKIKPLISPLQGAKDKDKDKDKEKEKENKGIVKGKTLDSIPEDFQPVVDEWLEYKKSRKESYKSAASIQKFFLHLHSLSRGQPSVAQELVDKAIANNWAGIHESKTTNNAYNNRTAQRTHVPQGTGEYYTTLQIPISGKVG